MSVTITCDKVVKKFGDMIIIPGLSLNVQEGEFFTLLGPSGCGKTTLLRMIAGFNTIEDGVIKFNDRVINDLAPGRRNIGMVFQNYAIFPHMNVWKNVAFGLTNRQVSTEDIEKRVAKILSTVRIDQYRDRMPERLSGGQQQRVALARAIVIEPDVLLMDEPLSNLDAKLRVEMRNAIREIQKTVNITTVYVTHDQEEAMAVSDRIAIMNGGVIQQVGRPREIYERPSNIFVATFIGHSTILDGTLRGSGGNAVLTIGGHETGVTVAGIPAGDGGRVKVTVRPEEFYPSDDADGIPAKIISSVFLGFYTQNFADLENGNRVEFVDYSSGGREFKSGDTVKLKFYADKINIFDESGEKSFSLRG
jgi:iron(III) transport system ATP-binding protein